MSAHDVYGDSIGGEKQCAMCKANFPADLEHFYKRTRSNGRAYLSSGCKGCVKAKRSEFVVANKEKVKEVNRKTRAVHGAKYNAQKQARIEADPIHRAAVAERHRAYVRKNRESLKIKSLARYMEDYIKIREKAREYYIENKNLYREHRRNRRARIRGAGGSFKQSDLDNLFVEQRGKCFWCKDSIDSEYHADHFLPLAQGGSNHAYNIVLACPTCNISRGKKLPSEFFRYLKWVTANKEIIAERRTYYAQKMREHRNRAKATAS